MVDIDKKGDSAPLGEKGDFCWRKTLHNESHDDRGSKKYETSYKEFK